jgi:hypothetical protein
MDASSSEFWRARNDDVDCPFWDKRITEHTTFAYHTFCAPMPCCMFVGQWWMYPDTPSLIGFIRHWFLPGAFACWLDRRAWDEDLSENIVLVEELLARAGQADECELQEDIPFMRELICGLDTLVDIPDVTDTWARLQEVTAKFNDRWEHGGTWAFSIDVYNDPVTVGAEIAKSVAGYRDEPVDASHPLLGLRPDWEHLCETVLDDPAAQARFKTVLQKVSEP